MLSHPEQDVLSLQAALLEKSIRFGEFTLASGGKSDVYVDARLTTCSASCIALVGRVFLHRMRARNWAPKAVGGLTMGADPVALAIASESVNFGQPIDAFVVRKEVKKHGRQRAIEGIEVTEGLAVVIVDDVCTHGESTAMAVESALAASMKVIGAMCLVDREAGARDLLSSRFRIELESIYTLSALRAHRDELKRGDATVLTSVTGS